MANDKAEPRQQGDQNHLGAREAPPFDPALAMRRMMEWSPAAPLLGLRWRWAELMNESAQAWMRGMGVAPKPHGADTSAPKGSAAPAPSAADAFDMQATAARKAAASSDIDARAPQPEPQDHDETASAQPKAGLEETNLIVSALAQEEGTASIELEVEAEPDPIIAALAQTQKEEAQPEPVAPSAQEERDISALTQIHGVGPSTANKLFDAGFRDLDALANADVKDIEALFAPHDARRRTGAAGKWIEEAREQLGSRDA